MGASVMFEKLYELLDEDLTAEFRHDLATLGASPEEIDRMVAEVMEEPPRSEWSVNCERELHEFIKAHGRYLRLMLTQPIEEREEHFTDEQLRALIRENQRHEREARKFVQ